MNSLIGPLFVTAIALAGAFLLGRHLLATTSESWIGYLSFILIGSPFSWTFFYVESGSGGAGMLPVPDALVILALLLSKGRLSIGSMPPPFVMTIISSIGAYLICSKKRPDIFIRPIHSSSLTSADWLSDDKDAVPGLDSGHVGCTVAGATPVVVIWDDSKGLFGKFTMTTSGTRVAGKGYSPTETDVNPIVEFEANAQAAGWVRILDKKYDLKDGILFLVSTTANGYAVKQLNRDMTRLTPTGEGCREYAKGDDDIRAFFKGNVIREP